MLHPYCNQQKLQALWNISTLQCKQTPSHRHPQTKCHLRQEQKSEEVIIFGLQENWVIDTPYVTCAHKTTDYINVLKHWKMYAMKN